MSLFFNSELKTKKEEILRYVAILNDDIRKISYLLDTGIDSSVIKQMNFLMNPMMDNLERIKAIIDSMSESQVAQISVPWIDGKYVSIAFWWICYRESISLFEENINNYRR
ncbi:hypothetical protein [Limibacterium fermenti]|uniref:hypothetical protein n=1 Tax=Limibacterium fermenti TaxID=3229863 RepID=UPI003A68244E